MFRIKTREVTGVTEVTDGCGLLPRDEKKTSSRGGLWGMVTRLPRLPRLPHVFVFLGLYIYSILIIYILLIYFLLYRNMAGNRGNRGNRVTAGQSLQKKDRNIRGCCGLLSYLCWNAYSSVVVHLQHVYAILVELLACCKFVY